MTSAPLTIVELRPADVDAVASIERASNPRPWPPEAFHRELRLPFSHSFVARHGEEGPVVGFIVFWNVRGEVHILNIAVHPDHRRRGIGRSLVELALQQARAERGFVAYLEVRRSNVGAQRLYESMGFKTIDTRERYYDDNDEDALVMAVDL